MKTNIKKLNKATSYIVIVVSLLFFASCEKDITVDLPKGETQIVVEGYVEIDAPPYVFLSKSAGYFDPIDSSSLANLVVKGAAVTITDGITTDSLVEIFAGQGYLYVAKTMIGVEGRTYTLTVITEGKTVTATTTLPKRIALDSLWFKVETNLDSLGFVWAHMKDPDTLGNAYRWFAKRITKDDNYIPPFGSVFEDKFINGTEFDFAFPRGEMPNSANPDTTIERGYYKFGDTVITKFCTIDYPSFKFWRSAENQAGSNGNPFAAPAFLLSNVNGGAGVFCGYSASYDTLIIKP